MSKKEPYSYRRWISDYWSKYNKNFADEEAARLELLYLQDILLELREHWHELPVEVQSRISYYDESGARFKKEWEDTHEGLEFCPKCKGEGFIWENLAHDLGINTVRCLECNGCGWVLKCT